MDKNKSRRRLVSMAEAAEIAGVHHLTIRRWIAKGVLTGYRVGPRLIRVDLDELESIIQQVGESAWA
jgi:excisionase family DNA binding protein